MPVTSAVCVPGSLAEPETSNKTESFPKAPVALALGTWLYPSYVKEVFSHLIPTLALSIVTLKDPVAVSYPGFSAL